MGDEADELDDASAFAALIGKHLLIGISFFDKDDNLESLVEHDGVIVAASQGEGIVIRRSDTGEMFAIPPALDYIYPAQPAHYTLRSTGRVVSNPNLLATFNVYSPKGGA
jgi:hypothetical protein